MLFGLAWAVYSIYCFYISVMTVIRKIKKPLVAVVSHVKPVGGWQAHYAHKKYVVPLNQCDMATLLVPFHDDASFYRAIADRVDAFVLTGARSNVYPEQYGGKLDDQYGPFDPERDRMSFTFIEEALKQNKPILGICRGFQDMNVFMGGSLHQFLPDVTDVKHHILTYDTIDQVYKNRHDIKIEKGTPLHRITGEKTINVNTVHRQGIKDLGKGLTINAKAPDGIIEAIHFNDHKNFALGVQWHPEYDFSYDINSRKIYNEFAKAAYQYIA